MRKLIVKSLPQLIHVDSELDQSTVKSIALHLQRIELTKAKRPTKEEFIQAEMLRNCLTMAINQNLLNFSEKKIIFFFLFSSLKISILSNN